MNYYFIANNSENKNYIDNKTFDKHTDIIIVFNHSLFENHINFKGCKVIHFYRDHGKGNHGEHLIINNTCTCIEKHILTNAKRETYLFNHIYKNQIDNVYFFNDEMGIKYNYIQCKKVPQSGSLAFEYFKSKNTFSKEDKIFLVGFTSIYKYGIWRGHSKKLEDDYFLKQMQDYNVMYENAHLKIK